MNVNVVCLAMVTAASDLQARARSAVAAINAPVTAALATSFGARLRRSRLGRVFGSSARAIRSAGQASAPH